MSQAPSIALRAALQRIMQKLEPELTARDAAALAGDVRRRKLAQQRIQEYLDRLDAAGAQKLFGAPLADAQNAGRVKFGGVEQSLNDEAIAALGKVISDPFKAALSTAKTPVPYLKPWMLNEEQAGKAAEVVLEGQARGLSWKAMGKLLQENFPQLGRPTQTDFIRGTIIEKQGVRVSLERYADMLARTQSVWANNQGALSRCDELGVETVIVPVSPGTIDFCLELEGKVYALSAAAAEEWGVPLLASTPNGGPPWHPNCRHSIAPYTPRKKDRGKLERPDEKLLTRTEGKPRGEQVSAAQAAFKDRLERDPLRYADKLAESAARRGFGGQMSKVPPQFRDTPIPGIVGKKEVFGNKEPSEDVHLAKRLADGDVTGRVDYRQKLTDTLRAGADAAWLGPDDNLLHYHNPETSWVAMVAPQTGLIVSGFKLNESWESFKETKQKRAAL